MKLPVKVSELIQPLSTGVSQIETALEQPIASMGFPTPPRLMSAAANVVVEGVRSLETAIESLPVPQLPAALPQLPLPTPPAGGAAAPAAATAAPTPTFTAPRKQRVY